MLFKRKNHVVTECCWAVSGHFYQKMMQVFNFYLINDEVIMPQLKHLYYVPYSTDGITDSVRSLIRNYNNDNRETILENTKLFSKSMSYMGTTQLSFFPPE